MASRQPYPLDHATHVPVLIGLGKTFPYITRVFEFGAGLNSTPLFLNKSVFPNVEEVKSIEPDLAWQKRVTEATKEDPRLVFYDTSFSLDPTSDLVFIDDGPMDQRIRTLQETVANYHGLIVAHDTQEPAYKDVLSNLRYRYDFMHYNPETSVGTNGVVLPVSWIGQVMARLCDQIAPHDVNGWLTAYNDTANWSGGL
jgi:hypothetical protein